MAAAIAAAERHRLKGRMTVKVHGCRELRDHQLIGKADPFAELEVGKEKMKTLVHKDGGESPVWNEAFLLNLDGSADSVDLRIRVFTHGHIHHTQIGRCDVQMYSTIEKHGYGKQAEFELKHPDDYSKIVGFIILTFEKFDGEGGPTGK